VRVGVCIRSQPYGRGGRNARATNAKYRIINRVLYFQARISGSFIFPSDARETIISDSPSKTNAPIRDTAMRVSRKRRTDLSPPRLPLLSFSRWHIDVPRRIDDSDPGETTERDRTRTASFSGDESRASRATASNTASF
jgi:hypothetical protein